MTEERIGALKTTGEKIKKSNSQARRTDQRKVVQRRCVKDRVGIKGDKTRKWGKGQKKEETQKQYWHKTWINTKRK